MSVPATIRTDMSGPESKKIQGYGSPQQEAKRLREACEGFESVFIQKMWEQMQKTVPKGTLMHSKEEHFWQSMYDQELAKKMTSAGGVGLADMMYDQLSSSLRNASHTTASGRRPAAFVAGAAPLLPSVPAETTSDTVAAAKTTAEADAVYGKPDAGSAETMVSAQKNTLSGGAEVGGNTLSGAAGAEQNAPAGDADPVAKALAELRARQQAREEKPEAGQRQAQQIAGQGQILAQERRTQQQAGQREQQPQQVVHTYITNIPGAAGQRASAVRGLQALQNADKIRTLDLQGSGMNPTSGATQSLLSMQLQAEQNAREGGGAGGTGLNQLTDSINAARRDALFQQSQNTGFGGISIPPLRTNS